MVGYLGPPLGEYFRLQQKSYSERMWFFRSIAKLVVASVLVPFICAGMPPQNLRRGLAEAQNGECASALRDLRSAVGVNSVDPVAINALGVCEAQLGDLRGATIYFERLVRIAPGEWQGWNNLGSNYLRLSRFSEAISAFKKSIKLNPNVASVWSNEASALLKVGRHEEAFHNLCEARRLAPRDVQIHKAWIETAGLLANQAAQLENEGQFQPAKRLLLETSDALGYSASWNDLLGYAEFKCGDPKPALQHLQEALRIDPDNIDYLMDIGEFLTHYRAYRDATEIFQVAEERMPHSPRVRFGLAVSYILENRRREATQILQQLVSQYPKFEPAYHALGECYEDAGNATAMIALGKELRVINARNPVAWYMIGAGFFQRGLQNPNLLPKAISALQHAVALDPKSAHTHFTLAKAYQQDGQDSRAVLELKETLRLDPQHERAHYVLAQLYQRMGETQLAKRQFEAHNKIMARNNHNDYRLLLTRTELR